MSSTALIAWALCLSAVGCGLGLLALALVLRIRYRLDRKKANEEFRRYIKELTNV